MSSSLGPLSSVQMQSLGSMDKENSATEIVRAALVPVPIRAAGS